MAEQSSQGADFILEFSDFGRTFVLLVFELLLKFFHLHTGSLVFVVEFALHRVVHYKTARIFKLRKLFIKQGIIAFELALSHIELQLLHLNLGSFGAFACTHGREYKPAYEN